MTVLLRSPEAAREAEEFVERLRIESPPIDVLKIAEDHEIVVEPAPNQRVLGCLIRVGETFGIRYSTRIKCLGLIRFTVAHELGHYFLPGHPNHLFPNGSGVHLSKSGYVSMDPYEIEADCFAASLLMPGKFFLPALATAGTGFAAIKHLAERFNTSLTATAIHYATYSQDRIAVIVSTLNVVNYCFMSEALKEMKGIGWLPMGQQVPEGTATHEFSRDHRNVRAARRANELTRLDFWFDGAPDISLREDVVGLGSYGKTLTVLSAA